MAGRTWSASVAVHLRGQGLEIELEDERRGDGDRVVTFHKRTQSTNDKTCTYLEGYIVQGLWERVWSTDPYSAAAS